VSVAHVYLLGVPMDLGAGRRGVDMGPSALRLARLAPNLAAIGHEVTDLGNVEVPVAESLAESAAADNGARFVSAIAATCSATAKRLSDQVPDGAIGVALGGDHSISMGTIPGLATGRRTGVLWIDAHADVHTTATSPSGNVHGMPVAHLLGMGDERLAPAGGWTLRAEDLVYIGLRSVDPPERETIARLGLTAYSMKEIDQRGIAAIAAAALEQLKDVDRLHVSFDADSLDPSIAPGVGTPVSGGLSYREAHLLMELLADSGCVTSVDLVEVNPILDSRNQTAAMVVEVAASLLGKRIL
jgi:arginase